MLKKITVICPVYNEEENIDYLIKKFLNLHEKIKKKYNIRFLFIDDGSVDNTKKLIEKYSLYKKHIRVLSFTKNFGYSNAICAGLENSRSDFYVCIDGDLQKNPNLIIKMLSEIETKKYDVIHMCNKRTNYESFLKKKISTLFYFLFRKITGINLKKGANDFWLITKTVRDEIISNKFSTYFIRGFFKYYNFRTKFIEYELIKRNKGKSKFNIFKQLELGLTGIFLYFKNIYLIIFVSSFVLFLLLIFYLIFQIYNYFTGNTAQGWTSIISLVTILGIAQLFLNSILLFLSHKILSIVGNNPKYILKK